MVLVIVNNIVCCQQVSDLVILRGTCDESLTQLTIQIGLERGKKTLLESCSIRIVKNSFCAIIPLEPGTNYISFHSVDGLLLGEVRLVCQHDQAKDSFLVQPLIVFSKFSPAEVSTQLCHRVRTGLKICQWYFSEKLFEAGYSRRSFALGDSTSLELAADPGTISELTSTQAWELIALEIRRTSGLWSERVKYVAFLTHPWKVDEDSQKSGVYALEPRSAVAAGGLALVNYKVLSTWPVLPSQIFDTLESDLRIENDGLSPLLSTIGIQFGLSLGIVAHELGHVFDLGHDTTGLMGSDFRHFEFSLRPKLKSALGGHTKRVYLTSGKIYEDPVQLSEASLALLWYSRWFHSNSITSPADGLITLTKNLVTSGSSLTVIQVREGVTGDTLGSWVASGTGRSTFSLSKRFVPRKWAEKSLEVVAQNVSGIVLKATVDFSAVPEGPTPIKR